MKLRKLVSFAAVATILGASILAPIPTFASDSICDNDHISDETKAASGCTNVDSIGELPSVILGILNAVIAISGLVAVIFIIVGGIQYTTSTGDPGKTKKAKDTILYALIGLIICALSFAIVNWVIIRAIGSQSGSTDDEGDGTALIIEEKNLVI